MHLLAGSAASSAGGAILWVVVIVVSIAAYWLPTIVALSRHVPAAGQVVVVNLFLGWSVIGWVVALVMAFRTPQPRPPAAWAPQTEPPQDRMDGYG